MVAAIMTIMMMLMTIERVASVVLLASLLAEDDRAEQHTLRAPVFTFEDFERWRRIRGERERKRNAQPQVRLLAARMERRPSEALEAPPGGRNSLCLVFVEALARSRIGVGRERKRAKKGRTGSKRLKAA